ncbi:hypothetical protein, conserved [Leishmania donovani]|uniref:2, 3-diketo-5-methylthio-1-phosphopentane phosphatase n=1 Tax=Leishmania donovani TaxID=5661 RepID=E9BUX4_LEIDO|nr:hypothetical protein, conserved [Leishmania donovani]TPP48719.1 2, 3-diketo-5-methylthio-1-phosphopentane phosphatase [Leishmania donovani]CBZ39053.1 hypothetical protein, conserved [Leishmania donovani]
MLRNALSCFVAQLELARLTGTLPSSIDYEELVAMVQQRLQGAPGKTLGVFELLQAKEIHLPEPDNPNYAVASMLAPLTVFLFDIEGTTTPLPFVQKVMMPLAESRVEAYMAAHFPADQAFVDLLTAVAEPQSSPLAKAPTAYSKAFTDALAASGARDWKDEAANEVARSEFCAFFHHEIKRGSDHAAVKAVQAAIWTEVFAEGKLQSQVFPDVSTFFRFAGGPAMAERTRIALYSSGSIAAQKLVMGHTPYGDLNPFITAYFDPLLVGTKLMPKSYMKIRTLLAEKLDIPQESMHIVFVTDNTSEASAAETSGAVESAILCVRPLNDWITFDTMLSINVPYIMSFTQLMQRNCDVDMAKLVSDTKECMKQHNTS